MSQAPVKVIMERIILRKFSLGLSLTQINTSRVGQCRYLTLLRISGEGQGGEKHMINSQDSFLL